MFVERNRWRRPAAALLLSLTFAIAMATFLSYYKFRHTLSDLFRNNVGVAAQSIDEGVRISLSMGLNLGSIDAMPALLDRQSRLDPAIKLIKISDMTGKGLYASQAGWATVPMPDSWCKAARLSQKGLWLVEEANLRIVGGTLRNSFDLPVGILAIQYSTGDYEAAAQAILFPLISQGFIIFLMASVVGALLLGLGMRFSGSEARLRYFGTATVMLVTVVALAVSAGLAVPLFERNLLPQLEQNARIIGQAEAALLAKAMSYGIPLKELYGVEQSLDLDLVKNPALATIRVLDSEDRPVFQAANIRDTGTAAPIVVPMPGTGSVRIGLDPGFARKMIMELALDIVIVLVVALFFSLELLAFLPISTDGATDPLRACRDIRTPAFIFFLSEELTRPFLPNFIADIAQDVTLLPQQIVIGLPIMVFMLIVALSQPWLGSLSQRFGYKRVLLAGAAIAIVGFVACFLSTSIEAFLLARSICAIGYAAIFVAAQGSIIAGTSEANRSTGFSLFVASIMVATVCGPSIGGILADNIGPRSTFMVSATLSALTIPFILRLPFDKLSSTSGAQVRVRFVDTLRLLRNRRFMALCLGAAVPAKILLTGGCFFLLPLYVLSIGGSQAMAGRLLMVYGIFMVLLMPVVARHADRHNLRASYIVAGLCVSAIGGLAVVGTFSLWNGLFLVAALGIGQAMSITSQSTLVAVLTPEESAAMGSGVVYGVYRLLERLGNAMGPMLAAGLLAWLGFKAVFIAMGGLALTSALIFYVLVARHEWTAGKAGEAA